MAVHNENTRVKIPAMIQSSVNAYDDLFETMLFVVDKIKEDWGGKK